MSFELTKMVIDKIELPPTQKLVLIVIASHQGKNGAYPAIERIAKMAGISKRHCKRIIHELVELKLMQMFTNDGRNGSNRYFVNTKFTTSNGTTMTIPNCRENPAINVFECKHVSCIFDESRGDTSDI